MKYVLCSIVALAAAAPLQAEVFNGVRIGAQTGVEIDSTDSASALAGAGLGTVTVNKKRATGATVGVTLGYDTSVFESFVIGAEVAGSYSTGRNRQVATFSSAPTTPVNISYKSTFTFEATVRFGMKVGESTLLYARGGYVNRKLDTTVSTTGVAPVIASGNSNGWLLGAGVEHAFGPKLSGRLEYRYLKFQGPSSRQQLVFGVGYSF